MPRHFAALGDSFSAGFSYDGFSPWPVLLVDELRRWNPELRYSNLAWVGARTDAIETVQVPRAVVSGADLITLTGGANDVLLTVAPDLDPVESALRRTLFALREARPAATIVALTYGDFSPFIPFRPRSRERVRQGMARLNRAIRQAAADARCSVVDIEASPLAKLRASYSDDGIHPSEAGHGHAAAAVRDVLEGALAPRDAA